MAGSNKYDVMISIGAEIKAFKKQMRQLDKDISKMSGKFKQNEGRFQGWALSVMFFGMQMQSTFSDIWKQSSKVFNDVMHSVAGTVTGFDLLNGSVTYLQYSIGAALEPIAMQLAPIVDKITEWVQENETLVAGIVKWGFVLGSVLFLVGFLTLAFNGVWTMLKNIKVAFDVLKANPLLALATAAIIVLGWLLKIKNEVGGWGNFFLAVIRGVSRVFILLASVIAGSFTEAWNAVKMGWNLVVDFFERGINGIIDSINYLIRKMNDLLGTNMGTLDNVDFSGAKAEVRDFGDAFLDTYGSIMDSYLNFESRYLQLNPQGFSGTAAELAQGGSSTSTSNTSTTYITNYNDVTIEGTNLSVDEIMDEYQRRSNTPVVQSND